MKRYDPIEYYDQGGHGLGQMQECADGEYLRADDVELEMNKLRRVIRDFVTIYCGSHPEKDESSVLAAAHSALANNPDVPPPMNNEPQTHPAPTMPARRLGSGALLGPLWKPDLRDLIVDLHRVASDARNEGSECAADNIDYAARSLYHFAEYRPEPNNKIRDAGERAAPHL